MPGRSNDAFEDIVGIVSAAAAVCLAIVVWLARPVIYVLAAVGRPMFGHLADRLRTPAVAKEHRETLALYGQAKTAYAASQFHGQDPNDLVIAMVREAMDRAEEPLPSVSVLASCGEVIAELMIEEGWWEVPEVDGSRELSLDEAMHLRNYLRRQERLFSNASTLMEVWSEKVIRIAAGTMGYLPSRTEEDENGKDRHQLKAPLVDIAQDPAEMIERLIITFFDQDVVDAGLFEDIRERLDINALQASGIDPAERHRTHRTITLPTAMRRKTPTELVELYLAGTPFERFLLEEVPFSIPPATRFEHCHIVGGTGHGKTQLLQQLIHHDLMQVRDGSASLVVIDSQGDLIRKLSHLAYFRPGADDGLADRLMLIDPNDIEHPVGLNMFDVNLARLQSYSAVEQEKILNGTIELYDYLFGALLGAELTQKQGVIFRYLARLMLSIPNATIQTLRELMEDGRPYKPYMEALEGTSRRFFENQFFDRSFAGTKQQILRRLWGVLSNTTFDRMFSNPQNKVDIFDAMNSGKVILINTAKDLLKQEGCEIFGRFFIAMIAQAALQRSAIPEDERLPTFVYIDEAQDYLDEQAAVLFNQARKYNVALHVAHQNLDQLSRGVEASIMASTSIKLVGGVSAKDAGAFAKEMQCEPEFIRSMRKRRHHSEFACWVKNTTPQPIRLAIPLGFLEGIPSLDDAEFDILTSENRRRYCVSRVELEEAAVEKREVPSAPDTAQRPPVRAKLASSPADKPAIPPSDRHARPAAESRSPPNESRAPQETRHRVIPPHVDMTPSLGRGGKEHKYLQELIKQAGHERGFHAVVEREVLDGAGRIDVALEHGETKLAVEISITTPPEQELANVEKCLAAGYDEVIVVSPDAKRLRAIRVYVTAHLDEAYHDRVRFLAPDTALVRLDELAAEAETTEATIRGYRVKVTHKAVSEEERAARRKAIAGVIRRSLQHLKGNE